MRRRHFFKLAGGAALAALLTGENRAEASSRRRIRPNPEAVGVLFDASLCIGCRKCEAACQRVNADTLPLPERPFEDLSVLDQKRRTDFRSYTVVNRHQTKDGPVFRKQQCNHCLEPACVSACLVRAMIKTPEGPVVYRPDLCLGCRYCMVACPYYAPAFDYHNALNPLIYKCTLCAPRLARGLLPGCVEGCPTGALTFGTRNAMLALAHRRIADKPGRYQDHIYGETEMGGTSWLYLSPVPHALLGLPELGTRSAPEMTSSMTGNTAMIIGLWPALLGGMYAIGKFMDKAAGRKLARAVSRTQREDARKAADTLRAALGHTRTMRSSAIAAALEEAAMQQDAMEQGAASFRGLTDTDSAVTALQRESDTARERRAAGAKKAQAAEKARKAQEAREAEKLKEFQEALEAQGITPPPDGGNNGKGESS